MRALHVTFLALVVLTTASFALREGPAHASFAVPVVLALATVKASLVGAEFLELRSAHWIWKLAFAAVLLGTIGALCVARVA